MADGTGFQDAEIKPIISTDEPQERQDQLPPLNENPQQTRTTEDETIQKTVQPSEAETQTKIEKIDEELEKINNNGKETEEIESTTSPDSEDGRSITEISQKIKKKIPNALAFEAKAFNLIYDTNVIGKENLEAVPQGKNIIFVTTHNDDSDVPLAVSALGKYYKNLTVVEESTHFIFRQDPISFVGRLLHWRDAFRVDYNSGTNKRRGKFDPDNFEPMKKSLEEGKPLVMSAFFTPDYSKTAEGLPKKTDNGAAYLAQITKDVIILPVAVDIKLDKPVLKKSDRLRPLIQTITKGRRTNADIIIGKPFIPDRIEKIDHLTELLRKRTSTEPLTKDELQEYLDLKNQLKKQSRTIMQHLAELLPLEKRGVWDKK